MQRVELHAWFVVNPGDRRLASRDHVGAVLGSAEPTLRRTEVERHASRRGFCRC
jgi:hypothetical protein